MLVGVTKVSAFAVEAFETSVPGLRQSANARERYVESLNCVGMVIPGTVTLPMFDLPIRSSKCAEHRISYLLRYSHPFPLSIMHSYVPKHLASSLTSSCQESIL